MAQLVERPLCKRKAAGANPAESTIPAKSDSGVKSDSGSGCDGGLKVLER